MDDRQFDALTRSLAAGASRRYVLKGLLGGIVGVALGGANKTFAQDDQTPVPSDTTTDPVVSEEPPPDDATVAEGSEPPGEMPPTGEQPPTDGGTAPDQGTPPDQGAPPAETPTDPQTQPSDVGTPADPAGATQPLSCAEGQVPCETLCCDPGWRCCGVYCIPDREGSCCGDAECPTCQICGTDGVCFPICDSLELECCVDDKTGGFFCAECCRDDPSCGVVVDCDFCEENGWPACCVDDKHRVTCSNCCDDSDCYEQGYGACSKCYGGYCLSCFDQTDGHAPICAADQCALNVSASGGGSEACVQCCEDAQCGPCEVCDNGWCRSTCDGDEQCCLVELSPAGIEWVNGGYCAHCCGSEDCSGCEECERGHCQYACDSDQTCCHDEFCAPSEVGCCGLQGDWCTEVDPTSGLNGACCDNLRCCFDNKGGSGSCAQCCGDYDCPSGWHCCGGTCNPECCYDHDCKSGVCDDQGYCADCRDDQDCGNGTICCSGECIPYECCYENGLDPDHCSDCEACIDGYCRPTGVSLYGVCNPMYDVNAAWDGTPQLNCCDGLVCCDTQKYGLVCLECCGNQDCADGCTCEDGFCSCGCSSDHDCAKGTCCCKNGTCSSACCEHPHKPHEPKRPPTGSTTVTTLPGTGSGDRSTGSSWLGAAALGAAAAYLAGRKLRPEGNPEPSPSEE